MQPGLGAGRSKYYPSESARTLLKECFADNPPVQLDPHQQLIGGMSSDQMIQFARAVGLEVSLATFGMLEDVLLKIGGRLGEMSVRGGVGRLFPLVGQGLLLWIVWLRDLFILCQQLRSHLIVIVYSNHVRVVKQMQPWVSRGQK